MLEEQAGSWPSQVLGEQENSCPSQALGELEGSWPSQETLLEQFGALGNQPGIQSLGLTVAVLIAPSFPRSLAGKRAASF